MKSRVVYLYDAEGGRAGTKAVKLTAIVYVASFKLSQYTIYIAALVRVPT